VATILDRTVVRLLPTVPRPVVRRLSARYIAGPDLNDAMSAVRVLGEQEKLATIDILGEEVTDPHEAAETVDGYREVLSEIGRARLQSNISVKPTALGLSLDDAAFRANLSRVVRTASSLNNFVRIDMEDSTKTDATLAAYEDLRADGAENVGIVLQASLRRTLSDVRALARLVPNVRLCKGIYVEPEAVQFRDYEEVRMKFLETLDALLESGSYVAVATHDEVLIERSLERLSGVPSDRYEFQMLLGVRSRLGDELVEQGHRLRVYVPFGQRWYEYSLRRLQENPKIAGYVASDVFERLFRRGGA
jgi:proline dehydrogenase